MKTSLSWNNSLYITIDMDWACDAVLVYTIDYLEKEDVSATFLVTHDTPLLARLRKNPKFELGIHPNFQKLLNGTSSDENIETVLAQLLRIVPEATSARSHSLVTSSPLVQLMEHYGIKNELNQFIPFSSGIKVYPYHHFVGSMNRIPFCFEDDVQCIMAKQDRMSWNMQGIVENFLGVWNFHPIHLFLNTEALSRYEKTRKYHRDTDRLCQYRFKGDEYTGSFKVLQNIIAIAKRNGIQLKRIDEIAID